VTEPIHKDNTEPTSEVRPASEPSQSLSLATESCHEAVKKSNSDKTSDDSEVATPSTPIMIRERPHPPFPQRLSKAKEDKQY
ncbi:hypothetical protein A2U01_0091077, partial [Trifolium medium]|nr:hypothetical protein [Trifolium medium]